MRVVWERRLAFSDDCGSVEVVVHGGDDAWSELLIVFADQDGRASVNVELDEAIRIVDMLDSALFQPGVLHEVRIEAPSSCLSLRTEAGGGFAFEVDGVDNFRVAVGRLDGARIRNLVQTFVEAAPSDR